MRNWNFSNILCFINTHTSYALPNYCQIFSSEFFTHISLRTSITSPSSWHEQSGYQMDFIIIRYSSPCLYPPVFVMSKHGQKMKWAPMCFVKQSPFYVLQLQKSYFWKKVSCVYFKSFLYLDILIQKTASYCLVTAHRARGHSLHTWTYIITLVLTM